MSWRTRWEMVCMSYEELLDRVLDLVADELECDRSELTTATEFKELGADSFDLLELVTTFEEEFGTRLGDGDLTGIATIGDAVVAIERSQG